MNRNDIIEGSRLPGFPNEDPYAMPNIISKEEAMHMVMLTDRIDKIRAANLKVMGKLVD